MGDARRSPASRRTASTGTEPSVELLMRGQLLLAVLDRLITDEGDCRRVLRHLRIGGPGQQHGVVILECGAQDTAARGAPSIEAVHRAASDVFHEPVAIARRASYLILFFVLRGWELTRYEGCVEGVLQTLKAAHHDIVSAAGGGLYHGRQGLQLAYEEACQALLAPRIDRLPVGWFRLIEMSHSFPVYSSGQKAELGRLVRTGDRDGIRRLLAGLFEQNFERQLLTPYLARVLMYSLHATAVELASALDGRVEPSAAAEVDRALEELDRPLERPERFLAVFTGLFCRISDLFDEGKRSHNRSLIDDIRGSIRSSYLEPGLCVSLIASRVGVSETYLSSFFKEQTGELISRYIERMRVQHARELLREVALPVEEVAQRSGFGSVVTFRRAFHRVTGTTPRGYRGSLLEERTRDDWSILTGSAVRELVFAHSDPSTGPREELVQIFAEKVRENTNGRYIVKSHPDSVLGYDTKLLKLMARGAIDFVAAGTAIYSRYCRDMSLLMSPFLVQNADDGWRLYSNSMYVRIWYRELESSGFKILTALERGFRCLTTRVPVREPQDLQGMKIRVPPNPIHEIIWQNVGAIPVFMEIRKVYEALRKGIIDGQENPISTIWVQRFHEVAPHLTLTRHVYSPILLAISTATWERLPRADREAIELAARHTASESRARFAANELRTLARMRAEGATVYEPDISHWMGAMMHAADEFKLRFGVGVDFNS